MNKKQSNSFGLPADVKERLDMIATEMRGDRPGTISKLLSHYAMSMTFLDREKLLPDYQEFCAETMADAVMAEDDDE